MSIKNEESQLRKDNYLLLGLVITSIYGFIIYIPELLNLEQFLFNNDPSPFASVAQKFILRFVLSGIVWLLIVPYILYKLQKTSFHGYRIFMKINMKQKVRRNVLIGIGISILFFSSISILAILLDVYSPNYHLLIDSDFESGLGWLILIFALIPGIWEELAFRGVLFSVLMKKYSEKESIIYSSLFFSFFHIFNYFILNQDLVSVVLQSVAAIFVGLVLANLMIKTKSIISGVIIHYSIDVTLFISGLIFNLGDTDNSILFALFALMIVPPLVIYISTTLIEYIAPSESAQ